MTLEELREMVAEGESETLELKATTGRRSDGAKTLCGMLNARGGRVVFGVRPDGGLVGQQRGDGTLEDVAAELKQIEPPVFPTVEVVRVSPRESAVVVSVPRGPQRPYAYRNQAYGRVGATTPKLDREASNRMLLERMHGEQRWENQVAEGWSVADLDGSEISRTVDEAVRRGRAEEPGTRDPAALLEGLGLMDGGSLLRAAVVLFGREQAIERRLTQGVVRAARFRGIDKGDFIDNRQFYGNAFALLTRGERFLREHLPVAGRVVPELFERVDDPLYPPVALREALANALCHRDYGMGGGAVAVGIYDDRLEITSSGPLHFGVTPESLYRPHASTPWNPLIAQVFYRRGIIESWGRGTLKIVNLTASAGLPRPEIEADAVSVTVRFRPSVYVAPERIGHDLTQQQQAILTVLGQHPKLALRELVQAVAAAGLKIERRELREELQTLRAMGAVRTGGWGAGAGWWVVGRD